jgi:predicted DCC family thiol-disulfide oxidoreductase YuxK
LYAGEPGWFKKSEPDDRGFRNNTMNTHPLLNVFYNGACPVCRFEISHYQALAEKCHIDNLVFTDLAAHPNALARYSLRADQAKRRLYAETAGEALMSGIDSFIAIWERLPWYRGLARVVRLPGLRHVAALGYDHIAVPWLARVNRRRDAKNAG